MSRIVSINAVNLISLFCLTLGCSNLHQRLRGDSTEPPPKPSAAESQLLDQAEQLFANGKYLEAKTKYVEFQKNFPGSIFFQSSRLSEAQCSEHLGNPERAGEIYDDMIARNQSLHPQIAVVAMFRKSFVYEKLGDDFRALTTLLDLKRQEDLLPIEVAKLQMPGRMAVLYNKLGQALESEKYIQIMNENLETVLKGKLSNSQLAEGYFLMGSLTATSNPEGKFDTFARGFRVASVFLIKSIEANKDPWSERAHDLLAQQLKNYWNWIVASGPHNEVETAANNGSRRSAFQNQQHMAQDFLEALSLIELRKPVEKDEFTEIQKKIFSQLDNYQKDTQNLLVSRTETNELSLEYLKTNGIKRNGRLLPIESGNPRDNVKTDRK